MNEPVALLDYIKNCSINAECKDDKGVNASQRCREQEVNKRCMVAVSTTSVDPLEKNNLKKLNCSNIGEIGLLTGQ